MLCAFSNRRQPFSHDIGRVQTWCPGSVLGHGHQCECSILVVPVQKLEHGTRVQALSPKIVFRHCTRERTLSAQGFISAMLFTHVSLWFEVVVVTRWQHRSKLKRNLGHHGVWTTFLLGHGHQVWTRPLSIFVFCPFSREKDWHKYWIWQVATVRSTNHNVGTLKELSCCM